MADRIQVQELPRQPSVGCLADEVRGDFVALQLEAHPGKPLVYLDSAATSQKPKAVLDAIRAHYEMSANVHRGAHALAAKATEAFEHARESVAKLINAASPQEIVFTSGATDALNLVANSWGAANLREGDEVVLTTAEHHSNIVPWQLLAQRTGCVLKFAEYDEEGLLDLDHLASLLTEKTKLVSFTHVSNTFGTINPVQEVAAMARRVGARVLLDSCQSVPHLKVDVQSLGVDWIVASGHKMYGPTGVGFLWGKADVLEGMPPWKGGGEMIKEVWLEESTFAPVPARFEAGTPPIAQAVGLGAACEYLMGIGMERIQAYEEELAKHLWDALAEVPELKVYGPSPHKAPRAALASFNDESEEDVYPADIAMLVDEDGFAVRAGHHCAMPLHRILGARFGSARASLAFYNTHDEIDAFVRSLCENLEMLRAGEGCVFDPDDPDACDCGTNRGRS